MYGGTCDAGTGGQCLCPRLANAAGLCVPVCVRVQVLKSFEKKDTALKAKAATNLSFLYFLEGDIAQADKYANLAVKHDRYNAKALVNKGA